MKKRQYVLIILFVFGLVVVPSIFADEDSPNYGVETLEDVLKYGVEVRVVCTKEVRQHKPTFLDHIKNRLNRRGLKIIKDGNVVLRVTVTAISSDDGFYVVHYLMEVLQSASLAMNNAPTEAPVWDIYRMGEYREQDLLPVIDDMTREFLNDYISVN